MTRSILQNLLFQVLRSTFSNGFRRLVNPLSTKFIKWSNTLKQFVGKLPTNCLSVFDHFVGLALKGLKYAQMGSFSLPCFSIVELNMEVQEQENHSHSKYWRIQNSITQHVSAFLFPFSPFLSRFSVWIWKINQEVFNMSRWTR